MHSVVWLQGSLCVGAGVSSCCCCPALQGALCPPEALQHSPTCPAVLQIQLYMPQEQNPDYGILRAIAKDSEDIQSGAAALEYLDSGRCCSQADE